MDSEFTSIFIVGFTLFILYMYIENKNNEVSYVVSDVDNHKYLVRNLKDSKEAANLLAQVKSNLMKLCDHLQENYQKEDRISRLLNKFNHQNITETGKNSKYTSYSVNKGEKIALCLRSRDEQEKLVDMNTLMFVSIHELAHVMTKSIGHTEEFWKNFKFLLKQAIKLNLYQHVNYNQSPQEYCGITVSDTPLNDSSI